MNRYKVDQTTLGEPNSYFFWLKSLINYNSQVASKILGGGFSSKGSPAHSNI